MNPRPPGFTKRPPFAAITVNSPDMLRQLTIKNYAIIDRLEIGFDHRLNIITGETGAGKSIIVGALNMILGKRADMSVLRDAEKKAVVEGVFDVSKAGLDPLFDELDLDYDDETILRREIKPNGKSRAFVNDSPVTLDQLRRLTDRLVDLHAQHDTSAVLNDRFYAAVLDRLAGQQDAAGTYRKTFAEYRTQRKAFQAASERIGRQQADLDYLQFQWRELDDLNLTEADGPELEEELNVLRHAGAILERLGEAGQLLDEGEVNARELATEAAMRLGQVSRYSGELAELAERLEKLLIELGDLTSDLSRLAAGVNLDEDRLALLQQRQDAINRLLQKHHLQETSQLMALRDDLRMQIDELSVSEDDLKRMEADVARLEEAAWQGAQELSAGRRRVIGEFRNSVLEVLHQVGMQHAGLRLDCESLGRSGMNELGADAFTLMFSANKGVALQPIKQVASGGERSRFMLAVKSVMARFLQLPTMIFDEIDTGISGEVAGKVGEVLRGMSERHQVISISHLPQIAAQAHAHFHVFKDHSGEVTETRIRRLDAEEHVTEVARMLSGDDPGQSALDTARQLIGQP